MPDQRAIERLADAVLARAVRDRKREWLLGSSVSDFWIRASGRDPALVRSRIRQGWDGMAE